MTRCEICDLVTPLDTACTGEAGTSQYLVWCCWPLNLSFASWFGDGSLLLQKLQPPLHQSFSAFFPGVNWKEPGNYKFSSKVKTPFFKILHQHQIVFHSLHMNMHKIVNTKILYNWEFGLFFSLCFSFCRVWLWGWVISDMNVFSWTTACFTCSVVVFCSDLIDAGRLNNKHDTGELRKQRRLKLCWVRHVILVLFPK